MAVLLSLHIEVVMQKSKKLSFWKGSKSESSIVFARFFVSSVRCVGSCGYVAGRLYCEAVFVLILLLYIRAVCFLVVFGFQFG